MMRNAVVLRNVFLRNVFLHKKRALLLPVLGVTLIPPPNSTVASYCDSMVPPPPRPTSTVTNPAMFALPQHFSAYRNYSPAAGSSNIVVIDSEEKFNSSLRKAQDEASPAIFYFTAAWCGPCRLISPIIGKLSEKYPHVTTYKVDIDQEGLGNTLSKLNINSVPTLHFFKDGKKASEVIGADVQRLKDTMEKLYK